MSICPCWRIWPVYQCLYTLVCLHGMVNMPAVCRYDRGFFPLDFPWACAPSLLRCGVCSSSIVLPWNYRLSGKKEYVKSSSGSYKHTSHTFPQLRKFLRDWHMIILILSLVVVDVIILVIATSISSTRFYPQQVRDKEFSSYRNVICYI